jgi:hypothetical protein
MISRWSFQPVDRATLTMTAYRLQAGAAAHRPGADFHNPYEEVQLRGRVVERRPDPDLAIMDPVSHKYTGKPFPMRGGEGRVALVIEVDKARYTKLPFAHTPPG